MPPSKRKTARRKVGGATPKDNTIFDALDSSPSARSSAAKRRKLNGPKPTRKERSPTPEHLPLPDDDDQVSLAESEDEVTTDLTELVISSLAVSRDAVMVAQEHANELETQAVNAFGKIAGKTWTYYMRDHAINIGRPPDDRHAGPSLLTPGASSPALDAKAHPPVHIDLGPSKVVSRYHASIYYEDVWVIRVNGRNGVRVDNNLLKRNQTTQLHSGAILEIAGTQMMFVLPNVKPQIDQYFIDRANNPNHDDENARASDRDTEPEQNLKTDDIFDEANNLPSLAPAPAEYRRTATTPPSDSRSQRHVFDGKTTGSPIYGRGLMMESTQEIDYARDSAKDLKPPYSYAHLIAQAIFSSDEEKLTLAGIYTYIAEKYAFYRHANSGWQNSIRHNLSLNKAFQKVPRRTDEPGKGMKWQIAPESRQDYLKKIARRGPGNSSNPSSPASSKDVNPNFRGPNGQNLGYDTSMVSSFSARDPTNMRGGPINMSFPPYPPIGAPHPVQVQPHASQPQLHATSTPVRSRANTNNTLPEHGLEDSPLPAHYPSSRPRPNMPFYSIPTSSAGPQQSPSNPMLSSSYLDTPFHPSQHSVITPAPLRQNPRLAPPSTLVAPSKFMPESSPAGPGLFWKGFLSSNTPGAPGSALPPDMSPIKDSSPARPRNHGIERDVMSSSPPPIDAALSGSPSKPAKDRVNTLANAAAIVKRESEAPRLSLDRSISFDPPRSHSASVSLSETNGNPRLGSNHPQLVGLSANSIKEEAEEEEEDDDDGGFDLAKGFAPISSFSAK